MKKGSYCLKNGEKNENLETCWWRKKKKMNLPRTIFFLKNKKKLLKNVYLRIQIGTNLRHFFKIFPILFQISPIFFLIFPNILSNIPKYSFKSSPFSFKYSQFSFKYSPFSFKIFIQMFPIFLSNLLKFSFKCSPFSFKSCSCSSSSIQTSSLSRDVLCILFTYKLGNPALQRLLKFTPAVYPHLKDFTGKLNLF